MPKRQLAHLPGADDEDDLVVKVIEDLSHVIHGGAGHRDMPFSNARFCSHFLGNRESALKQCMKGGAGCSTILSNFIRALDLAGDLSFTNDYAVQAGHHAEEVLYCVGLAKYVERVGELRDGNAVTLGQVLGNGTTIQLFLFFVSGQIKLDAIARAQYDGFAAAAIRQILERRCQAILAECQSFAKGDGRRAVTASDDEDHHGAPLAVGPCDVTSVSKRSAN